jgi:hypothetical protein
VARLGTSNCANELNPSVYASQPAAQDKPVPLPQFEGCAVRALLGGQYCQLVVSRFDFEKGGYVF